MVKVAFHPDFQKAFGKIKHKVMKEQIIKQISKIRENPEIGKPMRHSRKGTRELYIKPYRLAYEFIQDENKVLILELYHKDKQ